MTRAPTGDGRKRRGERTRADIVDACQRLMMAGNFRPTAKDIKQADGFTLRAIFQHFPTLTDLYRASINDEVAHAIAALLAGLQDERAFAQAVVLGRIERRP